MNTYLITYFIPYFIAYDPLNCFESLTFRHLQVLHGPDELLRLVRWRRVAVPRLVLWLPQALKAAREAGRRHVGPRLLF